MFFEVTEKPFPETTQTFMFKSPVEIVDIDLSVLLARGSETIWLYLIKKMKRKCLILAGDDLEGQRHLLLYYGHMLC